MVLGETRRMPESANAILQGLVTAHDALADRMKAGGTRDDALRGLAQVTSGCVACHAIYRPDEAR
jgi:hypothetical protein